MSNRPVARSAKGSFRHVRPQLEQLEAREMPSGSPIASGAYAADQILVRWLDDAPVSTPIAGTQEALGNNTYDVHLAAGISVAQAIGYYTKLAGVDFAQPDYVLKSAMVPNDRYVGSQWALNAIGLPGAWNYTTGGSRVLVAVIDTGVDFNDTDLAANIVPGYNFVNNTAIAMDDNGHGTHVSGIIGAIGNNGSGVAGVDWNVQIMPLKFMDASGSGYLSDAVKAVNYAVQAGAKIINNSWGGGGYDTAMASAIQNAQNHGVIFVAAAGNNASNNDVTPEYPANYAGNNVISVVATDQNNNVASFSDYGTQSMTIAAPGVSILSTTPNNTYTYYSGTSMATPFVTGALALVWSIHPEWTYSQVMSDVINNANPLPSLKGKVLSGLLDVNRAMMAAQATLPTPPAATPIVTAPALTAPVAGTTSLTSGNVNLAAPARQTVISTITINQHITVGKLTATVNLRQNHDGDVNLSLVSPSGQTVLIFNHRGGTGSNLTNTIFDDASTRAAWNTPAPFTGTVRPDNGLSAFKNLDAYGTWKLVVTEIDSIDSGTLVNWALNVTSAATATKTSSEGAGITIDTASSTDSAGNSATSIDNAPSLNTVAATATTSDSGTTQTPQPTRATTSDSDSANVPAIAVQSSSLKHGQLDTSEDSDLDEIHRALNAIFVG